MSALGLPKTTEYALKILTCLSLCGGRPLPASAVARCIHIPERQASKVLHFLTWRGVTRSRRGPNGGYQLRQSPEGIRVAEVLELFQPVPDPDSEPPDDPLQRVWSETAGRCQPEWEQLTIAELARRTAGQWESSACSEAGVLVWSNRED